jgi:hypothetical protein
MEVRSWRFFGGKPAHGSTMDSTKRTFPDASTAELQIRHDILVKLIDALHRMLSVLAASPTYHGKLFHVNVFCALRTESEWANELRPCNPGFKPPATKINSALQQKHLRMTPRLNVIREFSNRRWNAGAKMRKRDKIDLQQYVTGRSLGTFNIRFKTKDNQFRSGA